MKAYLRGLHKKPVVPTLEWLLGYRPDLHEKVLNGSLSVNQAYAEAGVEFFKITIDSRIDRQEAIRLLNEFYDKVNIDNRSN